MGISNKMNYLKETKMEIKNAIIEKGINISDTDTFRSYANKINSISNSNDGNMDEYFYTTLDGQAGYLFNRLLKKIPFMIHTSNITDMSNMFIRCIELTTLDLSSFDTSKVTNMHHMFNQCSKLATLDLSSFNTSKVTNTSSMFSVDMELKTISGILDLIKVTASYNISQMFSYCTNLETVNIKNLNTSGLDVSACTKLSHDSLMYLINNLVETTTTKSITLGTDNLAKLTDEEKAIATNKGWTLG